MRVSSPPSRARTQPDWGSRTARGAAAACGIDLGGRSRSCAALVPSVEDDRISWRVEDPMHRERQLDDSEVGSEVAAGLAHLLDQERPDLQAQLLQLIWRQVPQVLWAMDRAQQSVRGG